METPARRLSTNSGPSRPGTSSLGIPPSTKIARGSGQRITTVWMCQERQQHPPPSTNKPATSTPAGSSPTQSGIIKTCNRWHKAGSGDTCVKIVDKYGTFTLMQFLSWNPAVGSDCTGLWANYYYCIGVPGTPTTRPTTATTTRPTSITAPAGPSPTQSGIIKTCNKWHKAVSGESCHVIATKYKTFTVEQFIKWNPAVKADCSALWVGYYYCIGKIADPRTYASDLDRLIALPSGIPGTPTKPPATTTKPPPKPTGCTSPGLPTPTQPGALCQCKKWHKVASGNDCDKIVKKYNIKADNSHKWNPQVGRDCQTLWAGYYVCVGA